MAQIDEIQSAVTDYVRCFIEALRSKKLSYEAIGQRLGVTKAQVQYIHKPEKYGVRSVGPKLELNAALLMHGGSIDALRAAALAWTKGVRTLVPDGDGGVLELVREPVSPSSAPPAANGLS